MKNLATVNDGAALNSAARWLKPVGEEIAGAECREQSHPLACTVVFSLDIPFYRTADQPLFVRST